MQHSKTALLLFVLFWPSHSDCFASETYTLSMDDTFTVYRNMRDPKEEMNLVWVVIKNGERVLARRAVYDVGYQYYANMPGLYSIYLENGGNIVSNTIEYTIDKITPTIGSPEQKLPDRTDLYTLEVDDQQCVLRRSLVKRNERGLTWVIVKDGRVKLERLAENEVKYCNVLRIPGPFKIYLKQTIGGDYYKVSNEITANSEPRSDDNAKHD